MKTIKKLLYYFLSNHSFRIALAKSYPVLKRLKIISLFQTLNKGSLSDPFNHVNNQDNINFSTYDLEGVDMASLREVYTIDFKKAITLSKNYTIGFLINPNKYDIENIKNSCQILGIDFIIYSIKNPNLYRELIQSPCDGIFIYPDISTNIIRNAFHEATQLLFLETKMNLYPSQRELNIYESKRTLANFLEINKIPHPHTFIFYDYQSAIDYLKECQYPVIFKTHLGASASGVEIIQTRDHGFRYAKRLFHKYYLRKLETDIRSIEWGYMILQEYIKNVKEYRIIKVGNSWFGYQKWKLPEQVFLSGSGIQKMTGPSERLLNFCYNIAEKHHFTTMCFDVFENEEGELKINELQTWFGSYDPSEMYVDKIPGRYIKKSNEWSFDPGFFNVYGSIPLRLIHFLSILEK